MSIFLHLKNDTSTFMSIFLHLKNDTSYMFLYIKLIVTILMFLIAHNF